MSDKILKHPEKEEIIKRLLDGESVKVIDSWLRKKYAKRRRLQISWVTLQKFRKEHLNLHGEVLEDLKSAKDAMEKEALAFETKKIISESNAYQKTINQIAKKELDAASKLLEMDALVNARLVYYFNLLESGNAASMKEDKLFLEYIREYRSILESWKKYIDGHADKKIEHNININIVNEQLNILKGIVFEILKDMSPELVPMFVDKLNQKMLYLNTDSNEYQRLLAIDAEYTDEY
jgi:hypothetical protein